VLKLSVQEAQ